MKGNEKKFIQLLADSDTRFVIPLYQRNYDWKEEHCQQLFTDIVNLKLHPEIKSHFFGSIVSRRASISSNELYIIDGQQRLTTVSIFLIALYNATVNNDLKCNNEVTLKKIINKYIVDEYMPTSRKLKLKPIKNDLEAYDTLLTNKPDDFVEGSNVTRNYQLFYNWIKSNPDYTLDDYFESVEKLFVIDINLDEEDDPQLIFESLNSTGKDLEEADKIRNYLLMSLSNDDQELYYNEYWNKVEIATEYKPTMFLRDYLTLKCRRISKIENLYSDFKRYLEKNGIERKEVLTDLLKFARYYEQVQWCKSPDEHLNRTLRQLSVLGSNVSMPFYLAYLSYADEENVPFDEREKVFALVQNYWARRIICNEPTNALNKVFMTLHYEVKRLIDKQLTVNPDADVTYIEVMKYLLLRKQGTSVFPDDFRLREEFNQRNIYHIQPEAKLFLFERMENVTNKEEHNIVEGLKKNEITIEHIMPQTLSAAWRAQLGDDADIIHEKYLHTFANLTITAYNVNYSNHLFSEKKSGYIDRNGNQVYGFNDSPYRLSSFLRDCDNWTEREILQRQQLLFDRFLSLWPMITTSFEPLELTDVMGFDEDIDNFTRRYIYAFTYKDERVKTQSWKDMLILLCGMIYKEHTVDVMNICRKEQAYFHASLDKINKSKRDNYTQFADGCYVWSSNSTHTKMNILRSLFDTIGIAYDELEFELYPQAQVAEDDTEKSAIDDNHLKFWTSFIAYNKNNDGKYASIMPSKGSWLGRTINNVNVNVVVSQDFCRVELYLYQHDAVVNKRQFDLLKAREREIEEALGTELMWQRLDDQIASRISTSRVLNYTNEAQWDEMFRFMTEYSEKFFEVFSFYLSDK